GVVSATWQEYIANKRKTRGDYGYTTAEQFGSPDQAQAEVDRVVAQYLRPGHTKQFSVAAIPGSRGLREWPNKRRHVGGYSFLYFAGGGYYDDVGKDVRRGGTGTAQVIHAATELYNLVHGAPACP